MMTLTKNTLRVKKTCTHASNQTDGFKISSHLGVKKYLIPFIAPGRVNARMRNIKRNMNGVMPVTYDAFPELLIPLMRIIKTIVHESIKKQTRLKFGHPIPSFMLSLAWRTSFL